MEFDTYRILTANILSNKYQKMISKPKHSLRLGSVCMFNILLGYPLLRPSYWPGHKDLKFCASKEAFDQAWCSTHPFHRVAPVMPQMREIEAVEVMPFDVLQLGAESLTRVELRGIGWQALQVQPLRRTFAQERFHGLTVRDRRAIQDDDPAGHLPQQVLWERAPSRRVDGAVRMMARPFALRRDGADR